MAVQLIGNLYEFDDQNPESLIGEGGMGKVYRGRNIQTGDTVAIKELRSEIVRSNPSHVERFVREAEALRRLNHPNIVNVIDTVDTDHTHYIIMDFMPSGSLFDLLRQENSLPIERVLEICLDLADALTRAHRLNIIHRDIKPANVLIAADGTPRLTDFGVARIEDKTNMTQTGAIVGTLHYLSPESLDGQRPDESADIWAFGVMLYEMLAGFRPFDEDGTGGLINAIINKEPRPLNEVRDGIPMSLANLVTRMLEKDPVDRIDSVRKVGTELENIIRGTDSDELNIDSHARAALAAHAAAGNFDEPTTNEQYSINIGPMTDRFGFRTMRDESGQEYIGLPVDLARRRRRIGAAIVIIGALIMLGLLAVVASEDAESENDTAPIIVVETVAEDEYMVLVADFFDVTSGSIDESDFRIFLSAELRQFFERDVPFSNVRIRDYNGLITTPEEARTIAEENRAAVIVWGAFTPQGINILIQIGSLEPFIYNQFDRETLERLLNVETSLTDPGETSITPYILGMLGSLHAADGNVFEFMRAAAMLEREDTPTTNLESTGVNAQIYTYFENYFTDPEQAIMAINTALEVDGGNAILYVMRSLAHTRLGNFETARRDAETAVLIGPDDWPTAAILASFGGPNLDALLEDSIAIAAMRPTDWFFQYIVGENYYNLNQLEAARITLDASIDLNPQASYPFVAGFLVALRQGEVQDAATYIDRVITDFPDPNFGSLVLDATFGESIYSASTLYSSVSNLIIGQYPTVIEQTNILANIAEVVDTLGITALDDIISGGEDANLIADLFMVRGIALCANNNLDEANDTLQVALEFDEGSQLLHLIRAMNFREQDAMAEYEQALVQTTGLSEEFDLLAAAVAAEEINCRNFMTAFGDSQS